MADLLRDNYHLVRVTMTDFVVERTPVVALWIAATPREQAVAAVARAVPPDWQVELINDPVSPELAQRIHLAAGTVGELSSSVS